MHTRHCLKIAARMNGPLTQELGQGVDPARMLAEPRYARDVLLVCEAMRGSELAELAARFRRALAADIDEHTAPPPTGFSASRFLGSLFGAPSDFGPSRSAALPAPRRGWFGRSRGAVK